MRIAIIETEDDIYLSSRIEKESKHEVVKYYLPNKDNYNYADVLGVLKSFYDNKTDFEAFLIPISLGKHPIGYAGVIVGLFLRLSYQYTKYCFKPIIFVGIEPVEELIRNIVQFEILFLPGSQYTILNANSIETALFGRSPLNKDNFNAEFLSKIIIKKSSVSKKHSLSNEWAIYRTATILNRVKVLESCVQDNNVEHSLNTLYFRYLLCKIHYDNPVIPTHKNLYGSVKSINYPTKYLLIDDYASHGWTYILKSIIQQINPLGMLSTYDTSNFDNENIYDIIEKIISFINHNDIDIVFLDLRLKTEDEYKLLKSMQNIHELSGFSILNKLRETNPAVGIIVFTASQQAYNAISSFESGADHYYIKESPDNLLSPDLFCNNLRKLICDISSLSSHIKEIKFFYDLTNTFKMSLHSNNSIVLNPNIRSRIYTKLDYAFNILRSPKSRTETTFTYSSYQIVFLIYWSIINEFIISQFGEYRENSKTYGNKKYTLVNNKCIYIQPKKLSRSDLPEAYRKRFPDEHTPIFHSPVRDSFGVENSFSNILKGGKIFRYDLKQPSFIIPSYLFQKYGESAESLMVDFVILNQVRNKLDFTHSKQDVIENELLDNNDGTRAFEDCKNILMFLLKLFDS